MRIRTLIFAFFASASLSFALDACKEGELDCRELCEAGQRDDCTAISGDCGEFCNALTNVQDPAGCTDEREAYADCLNEDGVCSDSCNSDESALSTCVGTYCLTRTDEPDCATLIASFQ